MLGNEGNSSRFAFEAIASEKDLLISISAIRWGLSWCLNTNHSSPSPSTWDRLEKAGPVGLERIMPHALRCWVLKFGGASLKSDMRWGMGPLGNWKRPGCASCEGPHCRCNKLGLAILLRAL